MNRELVGYWHFTEAAGHRFQYDAHWLESPFCRPLSLSLPLRSAHDPWHGAPVSRFFDNLLPEQPLQRQRLRLHFGAPSASSFDLLAHIGLDCPGAIQITRDDQPPPLAPPEAAPLLDARDVESLLAALRASPAQAGDTGPLAAVALSGAQDKTALVWHQGKWRMPGHGALSTHLLKLPTERHADSGFALNGSLENAWLCQRIAKAFDVPLPGCELIHLGAQRALLVERADRRWQAEQGYWMGLPREDICQAFGLAPEMKYQIHGGKSAGAIARFMLGSSDAGADRLALLRAMLIFWLLCAFDAHARRFAVRLLPGGRFRLDVPLGVLSAYPLLGSGPGKLAPELIRPALGLSDTPLPPCWRVLDGAQWLAHARACALPREDIERLILDIAAQAVPVSARLRKQLPAGFPVAIAEPILQGVVHAARRLRESL
ncbi:HipA domain-containing protein [Paludibacterium purpuratum]|nr:HipA domain-containing protein [Paludibacterium purpuratum]